MLQGATNRRINTYPRVQGMTCSRTRRPLSVPFLKPQENVSHHAGGVIAANTNPFTGIPVDAALVAHGGYGVYKNAAAAFEGDPEAAERALFSGSEMAGGAAGTAGQVRAVPRVVQNLKSSVTGRPAISAAAMPAEAEISGEALATASGAALRQSRQYPGRLLGNARHHRPSAESAFDESD